jgi:type II secretory pathway pseudopilin PulG
VVFIVGMLTAIAIPNLLSAQRRSRYTKAAADTKTAVTQAMVYGMEKNAYPTSLQALRDAGLASIPSNDPWGVPFQLAPDLLAGNRPGGEVYVYSKGPYGTGAYPNPFTSNTGAGGSVGYSSVYGSWTGF